MEEMLLRCFWEWLYQLWGSARASDGTHAGETGSSDKQTLTRALWHPAWPAFGTMSLHPSFTILDNHFVSNNSWQSDKMTDKKRALSDNVRYVDYIGSHTVASNTNRKFGKRNYARTPNTLNRSTEPSEKTLSQTVWAYAIVSLKM